ncbi:tRNA-dependent cyclodipeptide synthase [Streptomyces sp. 6N223]|uniref:tRNA-dependent cyclodipeptide synthase n=1 Tax=Streptomyces sp. 6N223 TaxID=3457412 RepID=UPI003FD58CDE
MTVRLSRFPTPFTVEPLTANCRAILDRGDHVLIGVSPGNSYFSEARITDLLRWAAARFRRVDVVIPDSAEVETWRALGYADDQAHRRARAKAGRVRNRVTRAWLAAGVPSDRFGLLLLSEIAGWPRYERLLRESEDAIDTDSALHDTYLRVAGKALRSHLHGAEPTRAQAERAMRYLVAETPLLLDTPGLLGVDSSVAVYHHRLEFLDQVFHGQSALRPSSRQGFVVVHPSAPESGSR